MERLQSLMRLALVLGILTAGSFVEAAEFWAEFEREVIGVIAAAESSVVSISRVSSLPEQAEPGEFAPQRSPLNDLRNPESPDFVPTRFGSGVLIAAPHDSNLRLVLTSYHLVVETVEGRVAEQPTFLVRAPGGLAGYARVRAADPRSDLALLEFLEEWTDAERRRFPGITLPDAPREFRKGQFVVALGNPYALARDGSPSAALGVVANVARRPGRAWQPGRDVQTIDETIYELGGLLQLDLRQHLGTSGGALLDRRGQLIGLTVARAALDGYEKSSGFAIPLDDFALRVIGELAHGWEVDYGLLGVQTSYLGASDRLRLREVHGRSVAPRVDSVIPGSPAQRCGIRRGDVILTVARADTYSPADVTRLVGRHAPGSTVPLQIWRPDAGEPELNLQVDVGKWPVDDEQRIIASQPRYPIVRGLEIDFPTARRRYLSGFEYVSGVLVIGVAAGSVAEQARIRPGDFISHVNGEPVRNPAEFIRQCRPHPGELSLQLADHRGPVRSVVLPPGQPADSRQSPEPR